MIKNVLGAVLGAKFLGESNKVDSATGAATGAFAATAIPFVISRLSIPTMIAVGVGGYVFKRYRDKNKAAVSRAAPSPKPDAATDVMTRTKA